MIASDGTVMHGLALIYVVRDVPGIARFKIVQEALDHTRVLLVADATFDSSNTARIRQGMEKRLGAGARVEIEFVDEIPAERSGKYRYVVSKVAAR